MKTCPSCNRTFEDEKKFCNYCGEVLSPAGKDQNIDLPTEEASELSKTSQEIHCPSCGKALPNSEAKFCRFCGAVLKPSEANIKPMSPVADAGATLFGSTEYLSSKASVFSKRSVWLISSLALAVALGGVVLFVSQTSKSAIPTTTQIQEVPAEKEGTNQAIPSPKTQRVETAQGDSQRDSSVSERMRVEAQSSEKNTARPPRGPVRVGRVSQEAKLVHRVEPDYPDVAQQARIQGNVYLQVIVEEQGSVSDVKVIRGYPLLNEAAVNAVRQWKYSPTLLNGEAVPVLATVVVDFTLPLSSEPETLVAEETPEAPVSGAPPEEAANLSQQAPSIDSMQPEVPSESTSPTSGSSGPISSVKTEEGLPREDVDREPLGIGSDSPLIFQVPYGPPVRGKTLADSSGGRVGKLENEFFEVKTLAPLSASGNKKGHQFTVRVVTPEQFEGAIIEGEVVESKAAGKVKGKSELQLAFDKLILTDGTVVPVEADLVGVQNSQGVADVDEEGHIIGRSSKRGDIAKTAISSGIGALIGGLLGGKKGAATGAAMGAATGLAVVFSTRGEDITFAPGSVFTLSVTTRDKKETVR